MQLLQLPQRLHRVLVLSVLLLPLLRIQPPVTQEAWPRSQLQRRQVCMWLGWCRLLMLGLVPTPPLCKHLWAQLVARLRPLLQLREVMMRRGQQWMKQG